MIETALFFGIVISIFEFVIICMMPIRARLSMLGNTSQKAMFHVGMLSLNLWVHWGTVVGTMSATLAFIASLGVLAASTRLFGKLVEGRYYTLGIMRYSPEELK